ncbi:MAG: hypothetical protein NC090_00135 [Anaeroplasma bactoclasticum]|nr:hypothetical protein [Anaeroplasma bactoclasticum]
MKPVEVIAQIGKINRTFFTIRLLMDFIQDEEWIQKWQFTSKTYETLQNNIKRFEAGDNDSILCHYIENDTTTLLEMQMEMMEDFYTMFQPSVFLCLDTLKYEEIVAYGEIWQNYSFNPSLQVEVAQQIEAAYYPCKVYYYRLKEALLTQLQPNEQKFIPTFFKQDKEITHWDLSTYTIFFQGIQKGMKYLPDKSEFIDYFNTLKQWYLLVLIGASPCFKR